MNSLQTYTRCKFYMLATEMQCTHVRVFADIPDKKTKFFGWLGTRFDRPAIVDESLFMVSLSMSANFAENCSIQHSTVDCMKGKALLPTLKSSSWCVRVLQEVNVFA